MSFPWDKKEGMQPAIPLYCSCVDGLGRSCLIVALLALYINEDLSPFVAIELVRHARGAAAIQTIKVGPWAGTMVSS